MAPERETNTVSIDLELVGQPPRHVVLTSLTALREWMAAEPEAEVLTLKYREHDLSGYVWSRRLRRGELIEDDGRDVVVTVYGKDAVGLLLEALIWRGEHPDGEGDLPPLPEDEQS